MKRLVDTYGEDGSNAETRALDKWLKKNVLYRNKFYTAGGFASPECPKCHNIKFHGRVDVWELEYSHIILYRCECGYLLYGNQDDVRIYVNYHKKKSLPPIKKSGSGIYNYKGRG
jgi:hypothetical protein